jgi:hypothetical protein
MTESRWDCYALIGTALAESGDSRQARRALRLAWKQYHLNHEFEDDSHTFLREIGQALAKAGDLRAARYVAEDIGHDFEYYTGDKEQTAQLLVYVSILVC